MEKLNKILYTIIAIFTIAVFSVLGYAVVNNYSSQGSVFLWLNGATTTINQSGMYQGNDKLTKGYDVVVCDENNGNNQSCDIVCKQNEDCGLKINNSIINLVNNFNGGYIFLRSGTFIINSYIQPRSNIKILGSGKSTVLKLVGTDEVFRYSGGGLKNFELGNLAFSRNISSLSVNIGLDDVQTNNTYIHDIDCGNNNYLCIRIISSGVCTNPHLNLKLERIVGYNTSLTLGCINGMTLKDSYFNEKSTNNNVLADIGYGDDASQQYVENGKIINNIFINSQNSHCLANSWNSSLIISENQFYCNVTAIGYLIDRSTARNNDIISDNYFEALGSVDDYIIKLNTLRSSQSNIKISNNLFQGNSYALTRGIKLVSNIEGNIIANTFLNFGKMCVLAGVNTSLNILSNTFKDCSLAAPTNRYLYIQNANRTNVLNNEFVSTVYNTNKVIEVSNSFLSTFSNNKYRNINSSIYNFGTVGEYDYTFADDLEYTTMPLGCYNSTDTPFNQKTIHNSSAQCTCVSGTWKCLTYT